MHPHVPTCFTSHLTIHTRNTFRRHHGSRTVSRYRCRRYRIFFWRDISIRRPNGRAIDACDNAGWRHPRSFFPHWYVVYSLCRFCSWFEHSFFFIVADGHAVLASASSTGHIALWDLNAGGRLLHLVRGAHEGAITSIEWIPGQPLLISSGEDNSVKVCSVHPTWRLQYGSMVL